MSLYSYDQSERDYKSALKTMKSMEEIERLVEQKKQVEAIDNEIQFLKEKISKLEQRKESLTVIEG